MHSTYPPRRRQEKVTDEPTLPPEPETQLFRSRMKEFFSLLRELSGPASVGMLIAASAYMVHGLFPILATKYAGLSTAQAGSSTAFRRRSSSLPARSMAGSPTATGVWSGLPRARPPTLDRL